MTYLDSYDDYWDVNKRLINDVNGQTLRNIPLRLYLPEQCPVIQEPVSYTKAGQEGKSSICIPISESADHVTVDDTRSLGSVLNEILPDVFPPDTHEAQAPASVVIHGISIPLDTPIAWMSQNMSFADNFLHLVICKRSSKWKEQLYLMWKVCNLGIRFGFFTMWAYISKERLNCSKRYKNKSSEDF